MRKLLSLMLGIVAIAGSALVAFPSADSASAAPAGAATNLKVVADSCHDNLARYWLTWTPSGKGPQRVDLSAVNNGFANNYASVNLSTSASAEDLSQLKVGTTYYARVVTFAPGGAIASDTLVLKAACHNAPAFTVPSNLVSTETGKGTLLFKWTAGAGNYHFCLDTATNPVDLFNFAGSWRNHGCGTTNTSLEVSNLHCDSSIYWRVFAWGTGSGHSQVGLTSTPPCVIGQPTQLEALQTGPSSVLLGWKPGAENNWFCVDVAKSPGELANLTGSWRNYGCWMTGSSISITNLDCGETYYWNVFAWNNYTHTRSSNSSFELIGCSTLQEAPIEDVDVAKGGARYYAEIVAALPDACHTAASHDSERIGNTFYVTVLNNVEPGPCAFVYDTYKVSVDLGNLEVGKTYKVIVNGDESETFVAS